MIWLSATKRCPERPEPRIASISGANIYFVAVQLLSHVRLFASKYMTSHYSFKKELLGGGLAMWRISSIWVGFQSLTPYIHFSWREMEQRTGMRFWFFWQRAAYPQVAPVLLSLQESSASMSLFSPLGRFPLGGKVSEAEFSIRMLTCSRYKTQPPTLVLSVIKVGV